MDEADKMFQSFFEGFGVSRTMVLSTSYRDHVTSRMMSLVVMDGNFYFQTDKSLKKYEQIKMNPQVALCIDNIQIEGVCTEIGHPKECPEFCKLYEQYYKSAYDRYSSISDERLFRVEPRSVQKWIYEDGEPYIEIYDFEHRQYSKEHYLR